MKSPKMIRLTSDYLRFCKVFPSIIDPLLRPPKIFKGRLSCNSVVRVTVEDLL